MTKQHSHRTTTTFAAVYGKNGPPVAVLCDAETDPPGMRFFTVVLEDSPGPDHPPDEPTCVDCLLELHPRLGRGLDIAVEHRGAEWDGEDWVPAPELWSGEDE